MRDATGQSPIFVICDGTGRVVLPSEGSCELVGRERAGVIGRSWEEWVDPGDVASLRSDGRVMAIAATGQGIRYAGRLMSWPA